MREKESFSWFPSFYLGRPGHLSLLKEVATQNQPGYELHDAYWFDLAVVTFLLRDFS